MARLLVVSRSMALALRLADSHEVVEHPAEALDSLDPDGQIDVVVLDVGEPATAVSVLDTLRRRGSAVPVLIVSGYQPAWAGLAALDLPGVVVVPLPITRTALLTGIERLESGRRARSGVPAAGSVGVGRPVAPPADELPTMVVPAPETPASAPAPFHGPGLPPPGYYTETGQPVLRSAAETPEPGAPVLATAPAPANDEAANDDDVDDVDDVTDLPAPTADQQAEHEPLVTQAPTPSEDRAADVDPPVELQGTADVDLPAGEDGPAELADATTPSDEPQAPSVTVGAADHAVLPNQDDPADDDPADEAAVPAATAEPAAFIVEADQGPLVVEAQVDDAPPPLPVRSAGAALRAELAPPAAQGGQFSWWPSDRGRPQPADLFVPARPISPHEALTEAFDLSSLQAAAAAAGIRLGAGTRDEQEPAETSDGEPVAADAPGGAAPAAPDADVPVGASVEPPAGSDAGADLPAGDDLGDDPDDDLPTLVPPVAAPRRPEVVDLPSTFLTPGEATVDWAPVNGTAHHAPPVDVPVVTPAEQVVDLGPADTAAAVDAPVEESPATGEAEPAVAVHEASPLVEYAVTGSPDASTDTDTTVDAVGDAPGEEPQDEADAAAVDEPTASVPPEHLLPEPGTPAPGTPAPGAPEPVAAATDGTAPSVDAARSGLPSFDDVLFGMTPRTRRAAAAARHASGEIPLPGAPAEQDLPAPVGAHRDPQGQVDEPSPADPAPSPGASPEAPAQVPVAAAVPPPLPAYGTPPPLPTGSTPPASTPPPPLPAYGTPPPPLPTRRGLRADILAEVLPGAGRPQEQRGQEPTDLVAEAVPQPAQAVEATAPASVLGEGDPEAPAVTADRAAAQSTTDGSSSTDTTVDLTDAAADGTATAQTGEDGTVIDVRTDHAAGTTGWTRERPEEEDHWSREDTEAMVARRRAILGREAPAQQPSALQRRLGDRRVSTGLSTGGASPELVALSRTVEDRTVPPTRRSLWGKQGDDLPPPPAGPPGDAGHPDVPDAADSGEAPDTAMPAATTDADSAPGLWGAVPPSGAPVALPPPASAPAAAQAPSVVPAATLAPPLPAVDRAAGPLDRLPAPPLQPLQRLEPPAGAAGPTVPLAPALAVPGPMLAPPPAAPTDAQPADAPAGTSVGPPYGSGLNGSGPNGSGPNGSTRNGTERPGPELNGHGRNGQDVNGHGLNGNTFHATPLDDAGQQDAAPADAEPRLDELFVVDAAVERRSAPSVRELVRALNERSMELFGVADTCQVLAQEVVERAGADAAAIVVPDGSVWRVNGGVGLRPIERRLVLDARHWLVTEVAMGGRALVVGDPASVRPRLAGAPLAGWEHLLAVPVPDVMAAVVVARSRTGRPFTEADLAAVVGPVHEAAGLLSAAMATRRLARVLAPLTEDDET